VAHAARVPLFAASGSSILLQFRQDACKAEKASQMPFLIDSTGTAEYDNVIEIIRSW
jgi:hypothetical protein